MESRARRPGDTALSSDVPGYQLCLDHLGPARCAFTHVQLMPGADINVEKPLKVVSQTACPGYYGTSVDIGQMNAVESTTATAAQTELPEQLQDDKIAKRACQVQGCDVDLAAEGPYCIKRRCCTRHIRADAVFREGSAPGQYHRFCFQCGKLEPLECFDGGKRSCRSRLQKRVKQTPKRRTMWTSGYSGQSKRTTSAAATGADAAVGAHTEAKTECASADTTSPSSVPVNERQALHIQGSLVQQQQQQHRWFDDQAEGLQLVPAGAGSSSTWQLEHLIGMQQYESSPSAPLPTGLVAGALTPAMPEAAATAGVPGASQHPTSASQGQQLMQLQSLSAPLPSLHVSAASSCTMAAVHRMQHLLLLQEARQLQCMTSRAGLPVLGLSLSCDLGTADDIPPSTAHASAVPTVTAAAVSNTTVCAALDTSVCDAAQPSHSNAKLNNGSAALAAAVSATAADARLLQAKWPLPAAFHSADGSPRSNTAQAVLPPVVADVPWDDLLLQLCSSINTPQGGLQAAAGSADAAQLMRLFDHELSFAAQLAGQSRGPQPPAVVAVPEEVSTAALDNSAPAHLMPSTSQGQNSLERQLQLLLLHSRQQQLQLQQHKQQLQLQLQLMQLAVQQPPCLAAAAAADMHSQPSGGNPAASRENIIPPWPCGLPAAGTAVAVALPAWQKQQQQQQQPQQQKPLSVPKLQAAEKLQQLHQLLQQQRQELLSKAAPSTDPCTKPRSLDGHVHNISIHATAAGLLGPLDTSAARQPDLAELELKFAHVQALLSKADSLINGIDCSK